MMTTRLPPVSLIHIGLPKTATTYLQTLWLQDPSVCLLQNGILPLIMGARRQGKKESAVPTAPSPQPIDFDQPPAPGQKLVISNEGLSNAYVNERATAAQIRCFQEHAATATKAIAPKAKVLLVIREPEDWIRSIYNQAIKQGGTDSFRQFLVRERAYLEQSLNLRDIFNIWKQRYGSNNVLILPLELLRDRPEAFHKAIERFSGLPQPPEIATDRIINPSLHGGHLNLMRQFNRWVELFVQHGLHQRKLPAELEQALHQIRLAARYMMESPTPALARQLRRITRNMPRQRPEKEEIPRDLLKTIRKRNAKQLKKDDFFGYREHYV